MKTKYLALLAIIPIFGIGLTASLTDEESFSIVEKDYGGSRRHYFDTYTNSPTNEPKYNTQKSINFSPMNIGDSWSKTRGENVTVAVIDSGVNIYHEDFLKPEAQNKTITSANVLEYSILNPKSAHIYDPTDQGKYESSVVIEEGILACQDKDTAYEEEKYGRKTTSYYSHGTNTAACIGAMVNNVGGTGIAPNVDLMIINCDLWDVSINKAIKYATDNGADIISMSFGGYSETFIDGYGERVEEEEDSDTSMQEAIDYAYNKGVTLFAAAGNEKQGAHLCYPAANKHVIGVGALARGSSNQKADFSCWNVSKNGVILENNNADVFAPGYVYVAGVHDKNNTKNYYEEVTGTSFACPLTAGAAALYKSLYPNATPDQIEQALFNSCYDIGISGRDATFGYGRVDVTNLLNTSPDDEEHLVESISINKSKATMRVNSTLQLSFAITPSNATNKNVTWSSDNNEIASVSNSGLVTAHKEGTTKIKVTTEDGNKYDECSITVDKDATMSLAITCEGAGYDSTSGISSNLEGYMSTEDDTSYVYSITGSKVYQGTSGWRIETGSRKGNVTLTFTNKINIASIRIKGSSSRSDCYFNVKIDSSLYGTINLNASEGTITKSVSGQKIVLEPSATAYLEEFEIEYTVDEETEPTTITKVSEITLSVNKIDMTVGDIGSLTAVVSPSTATNKTISWTSSNPFVVYVDKTGVITALSEGSATIYATATDGSGVVAYCTITVKNTAEITTGNVTIGCSGSIVATSVLLSSLSFLGAVLIIVKRKKQ